MYTVALSKEFVNSHRVLHIFVLGSLCSEYNFLTSFVNFPNRDILEVEVFVSASNCESLRILLSNEKVWDSAVSV
ncbi:hypothetical protein NSE_0439 [Neorickettsia sennetsu str. Miyayama]|uniref:Uncharacterized protein n=1 Tax=Ehrlichia sennetsu (strain ATCC VR-367 / Miyayama) TaxID=222891 RepID=Q2GDX2_EHRS3|nr:hypothetical protein NSE_0439 [Neorickettsia sennetsu str. Miyayama]